SSFAYFHPSFPTRRSSDLGVLVLAEPAPAAQPFVPAVADPGSGADLLDRAARRGVVRAGPGEAAHVHQLRDPGPGEEVGELVPLQAPVAHREQGARRRVRGHDVLPNSRRDAGSNSSSFPHEVHESTAASGLNASTPNRLAALLLITTRRDRNHP